MLKGERYYRGRAQERTDVYTFKYQLNNVDLN